MNTPTLTTARLELRPVRLEDAPAIQRGIANWAVIQNLSTLVPWPYPPDGAESFLRDVLLPRARDQGTHAWVIVEPSVGPDAIGVIEVSREAGDAGHRGFWLAEPFWGRGLMTEAIEAVQDWLFFEAGISELIVCNSVSNVRSRRVKEKTGAEFLGEFHFAHHSGSGQTERWRVTWEAWAALRGRG